MVMQSSRSPCLLFVRGFKACSNLSTMQCSGNIAASLRVTRAEPGSKAMRMSTAYFAGAGTVAVAVALGLGGGFLIAEMMNPRTPQVTKVERKSPDAPPAQSAVPNSYLAATQAATTTPVTVQPAAAKSADKPPEQPQPAADKADNKPPAVDGNPQGTADTKPQNTLPPATAAAATPAPPAASETSPPAARQRTDA